MTKRQRGQLRLSGPEHEVLAILGLGPEHLATSTISSSG